MGTSISALLIISVLLTAVVVMFKANQIGAELLATANKNAAETMADKVGTRMEIHSKKTLKADYITGQKLFEAPTEDSNNRSDEKNCYQLLVGIPREGEITSDNRFDCYYFDADANSGYQPGDVVLRLTRIIQSPMLNEDRNWPYGTTKISLDFFGNNKAITGYDYGLNGSSNYFDLQNEVLTKDLEPTIPTGLPIQRVKVWSVTDARDAGSHSAHGGYQITLLIRGEPEAYVSAAQCIEHFVVTNAGDIAFTGLDFSQAMDIFVELEINNVSQGMKVPVKGTNPLSSEQWSYKIINDGYQEGMFNPGETLNLFINLDDDDGLYNGGMLTLVMPNGVVSKFKLGTSVCPGIEG